MALRASSLQRVPFSAADVTGRHRAPEPRAAPDVPIPVLEVSHVMRETVPARVAWSGGRGVIKGDERASVSVRWRGDVKVRAVLD